MESDVPRLTVFYQDMPFPANQGGKADVWRRIQAIRRKGGQVQLVHWVPGGIESFPVAQVEELRASVDSIVSFRRKGAVLNRGSVWTTPLWMSKFRLSPTGFQNLSSEVERFGAQGVWVEGPWTAEIGLRISESMKLPLYYRSHNIEHHYMAGQARAERNLGQKVWMCLNFRNLERFEVRTMRGARHVFDISNDDLQWWRTRGISHNTWLPPVAEAAFREMIQVPRDIDVLFLGNLSAPNNVQGVHWLLDLVWPRVVASHPGARLVVAGSSPSEGLRGKIMACPGADILADFPDALSLLARAKVLVNPVLTGSGIQLKSMEMLTSRAPLVSTTQGLAGFPSWLKDDVAPLDDPASFADRIVEHLSRSFEPSAARIEAQKLFSVDSVEPIFEHLAGRRSPSEEALEPASA